MKQDTYCNKHQLSLDDFWEKTNNLVESNKFCPCCYKDKLKLIRELKNEINMLEEHISIAQPEDWDLQQTYEKLRDGNKCMNIKANPKFAKWFIKRYEGLIEEI